MEEFDDYGRPYVDANSWVRKEAISLLSGFEGLQYKFKKNAMSYCTNVWDIDFYQLRVAVLNHLQQNLRILKKYKNNTRVFLDNTYEMNVSLPKVNKTIPGRFYAEITPESSLIYLGAHNHNNTNKLPY